MHGRRFFNFFILFSLLFTAVPLFSLAGPYDLNVIDTPKTYTSYKGELHFDFTMYDRGGILGSAVLSISDYAFLGVYFDVGQMIGSEEMEWEQPGVLARFLLSDGSRIFPPLAVGYSYFTKGEVNKVSGDTVNGFYIVSSLRYYLFGFEQGLSYGFRYPIIPLDFSKPENLSLFLGTDLSFSPSFGMKGEIENVYFSEDRWDEIFYNFSFDFYVAEFISFSLEFKYSPSIDRMVRLLRIGYMTQF